MIMGPLPRCRVYRHRQALIEMPHMRASDIAMHVVTVGTRAKPLQRDTAKVRDVGDFRERAHGPCLRLTSAPAHILFHGPFVATMRAVSSMRGVSTVKPGGSDSRTNIFGCHTW
jgi:hypothetical protein